MKKVEISFKEVAIAVLRRWYVVLIVAAAFAFAFSTYARDKAQKNALAEAEFQVQVAFDEEMAEHESKLAAYETEYDKRFAEYDQKRAAYEAEREAYDKKLPEHLKAQRKAMADYEKASAEYWRNLPANKQTVEDLKAQISAVEDYLKHGIRTNVDPYNHRSATLTMDFDTEQNNTILNRATNHYLALAQEAPFATILQGVIPEGYNPAYVQEAVSLRKVDNDLLVISAIGTDQIDPEAVVKAVVDYLATQQDLVTRSAGQHTYKVLDEGSRLGMDIGLVNVRAAQENRLNALNRWLTDTENAIKAKPILPVEEELEAPVKPVRPPKPMKPATPVKEALVSSVQTETQPGVTIRDWVMGALGGLVLGVLLVMICYLFRLPVQYATQPQKQLGMRYLGGRPGGKEAQLIAANLKESARALPNLLLTGRLPEDTLDAVERTIKAQEGMDAHVLQTGTDVLENPDTVAKLSQADAAVLVVKQYHSKLRDINSDMERIAQSGKPLVGYIVI